MRQRSCETYRTLISALLDGDITPDEQIRLDNHLASCDDCRQVFDDYGSISRGMRDLPAVAPPPDLARSIRQATVERPPDPRWVRWLGLATPKLGLSTAAGIAVLILALSFVLVTGYRQSVDPAIASSAPTAQQNWPIYQPIRINFNKPMNHASVESGLHISPVGERERLPMSWDGNTLVIGSNGSQSQLLLPDTSYTVVVLADVKDAFGNPLGSVWTLAFHTGPSNVAVAPPIPTDAATTESTAESTVGSTAAAQQTPAAGARTPSPAVAWIPPTQQATTPQTSRSWPTGTTAPNTGTQPSASWTQSSQPSRPSTSQPPAQQQQPAVTAVPTKPAATVPPPPPPATSQPTAEPTKVSTPAPTPAQTPAPTATATSPVTAAAKTNTTPVPSATATSSAASATPSISVSGAFGSVYWANNDVQAALGAPKDVDFAVSAQELGFQHGTMYERMDTSTIYSLLADGTWSAAKDTWVNGDPQGGQSCGVQDLYQPKNGFFKLWDGDATLKAAIGCANKADATIEAGRIQEFQNGEMLYSEQGFVYVLYNDGTWKLYPDTSGHSSLITPTPEPATAGTPTATATATATGTATPAVTPAATAPSQP